LILFIYAIVLYAQDNSSKMGIIIAVSVVAMDIFNSLLYVSNMIQNAASIIVLFVVNRVAMVILGERYWVYGYMLLYMMYGIAILYYVAKKSFPLRDDFTVRSRNTA